jgi:hypothetical protein
MVFVKFLVMYWCLGLLDSPLQVESVWICKSSIECTGSVPSKLDFIESLLILGFEEKFMLKILRFPFCTGKE